LEASPIPPQWDVCTLVTATIIVASESFLKQSSEDSSVTFDAALAQYAAEKHEKVLEALKKIFEYRPSSSWNLDTVVGKIGVVCSEYIAN